MFGGAQRRCPRARPIHQVAPEKPKDSRPFGLTEIIACPVLIRALAFARSQALGRECSSSWSQSAPKTSGAVPSAKLQKQNSDMTCSLHQ